MKYHYKDDLPQSKFAIGELVTERSISAKKIVPFKIKRVVPPEADANGRYYFGYQYLLEVALPEDGDHFLHGKLHPEGLLMKFDHLRMETMLGAIYSRIEDIQSLIEQSETKRV